MRAAGSIEIALTQMDGGDANSRAVPAGPQRGVAMVVLHGGQYSSGSSRVVALLSASVMIHSLVFSSI